MTAFQSAPRRDTAGGRRRRLYRALEARGWEAHPARTEPPCSSSGQPLRSGPHSVDFRLPGMGGLDITRELRKLDDTNCIIMLTGYGSIATALTATRLGADH
jgi:two-component system, response regulator RegA